MNGRTGKLGRSTFIRCLSCFFAIALICSFLLLYSYSRERRLSEERFIRSTDTLSIQLGNNIGTTLRQIEQIHLSASAVASRYAPLLTEMENGGRRAPAVQRMTIAMEQHLSGTRQLGFILVRGETDLSVFRANPRGEIPRDARGLAERALEACAAQLNRPSGHAIWAAGDGEYVLLMRRIFDEDRMRFVGAAAAGVSKSVFKGVFDSVRDGECGEFALIDERGGILFETSPLEHAAAFDGGVISPLSGWSVREISLKIDGLRLIHYADMRAQRAHNATMLRRCLLLLLMALAVIFVFLRMTYFRTAQGSVYILRRMDQIAQGEFSRTEEKKLADPDMELILRCLEDMGEKIGLLVDRIGKEEETRQESEQALLQMKYDLLRSQVNPHFLYNALTTINSMAVLHDEKEIGEITYRLGRYFRASLMPQSAFSSLGEEMAVLRNYTSLYQSIYPQRLTVHYDIEEDCLKAVVSSLLFLPIVENALVHGMEEKPGPSHVQIRLHREGTMLRVVIEDDGVGISPEKMRRLMQEETSPSGRVGLLNVRRRLRLVYGEEAGLTIESEEGKYTRVSVCFPERCPAQGESACIPS